MIPLRNLVPGDEVEAFGVTSVFIGIITLHPIWPSLSLVVWRMGDGSYSLDALYIGTELPGTVDTTNRLANLRRALLTQ